jgi:hypothetical protein
MPDLSQQEEVRVAGLEKSSNGELEYEGKYIYPRTWIKRKGSDSHKFHNKPGVMLRPTPKAQGLP